MLSFKDINDLVEYIFDKRYNNTMVSVVADKKMTVEIMKELLTYDDVILDFCQIDGFEYDKEYLISLCDEDNTGFCHICIEQMFNYETNRYYAADGYVLFYEGANSKAQIDVINNEFSDISGCDWFKFAEEDNETEDDLDVNYLANEENDTHGFTVSKTNENGCFSYSFYTSEKLDKSEILDLMRNISL